MNASPPSPSFFGSIDRTGDCGNSWRSTTIAFSGLYFYFKKKEAEGFTSDHRVNLEHKRAHIYVRGDRTLRDVRQNQRTFRDNSLRSIVDDHQSQR